MENKQTYDVIIIGGSYAGLSAAMSLGRALRNVLIIDSGKRCNSQTPHAHNLITHDGDTPADIAAKAKEQVLKYDTVSFVEGTAVSGSKTENGFQVETAAGELFSAAKIVIATGLTDLMPEINGFSECWGISILHCPYCHGYEVRGKKTGVIGNGDAGYEYAKMITNWTKSLVVFTNGPATFTTEQLARLKQHDVQIVEGELTSLEHASGYVNKIVLKDGNKHLVDAIYARPAFKQQSAIAGELGCELTEHGLISVDAFSRTTVPGVYAAGDNSTMMRSLAAAIGNGSMAGAVLNKELIEEQF